MKRDPILAPGIGVAATFVLLVSAIATPSTIHACSAGDGHGIGFLR